MNNTILKNADEVIAAIKKISEVLDTYQNIIKSEDLLIVKCEQKVNEAQDDIRIRKRNLVNAYESYKDFDENSSTANKNSEIIQKRLSKLNDYEKRITFCCNELLGIKQTQRIISNEALQISNEGKLLSTKLSVLLNKIKETM